MTGNRCPIPGCNKRIGLKKFMCGEHRRMIDPAAWARVQKSRAGLRDGNLDIEQRADAHRSMKIALALVFADVCDKCGIDASDLFKQQPVPERLKPIARAIMTEIGIV